jgi:hypothetical protein
MEGKENLELFLRELGETVGIPELALDEEDSCVLSFDEIVVNMQYVEADDGLIMFSNLGRVPEENRVDLFEEMLEANFSGTIQGGAELFYVKETDSAGLIFRTRVSDIRPGRFEGMMEKFVNLAEAWIKRLGDGHGPEDKEEAPKLPDSMVDPGMRA